MTFSDIADISKRIEIIDRATMSNPSDDLEVGFDLEEERIDWAEEVMREQEQEAAEGNQATETPAATAREAGAFDVFEVFDGNPPAGSTESGTTEDNGRTTSEQPNTGTEQQIISPLLSMRDIPRPSSLGAGGSNNSKGKQVSGKQYVPKGTRFTSRTTKRTEVKL